MRLKTIVLLCVISFVQSELSAQMIKSVKKKEDEAPKPVKKNTRPIARIKEDDEPEQQAPSTFAFLTIRSNKQAGVTVTVNDTVIGKVKAAAFKKIPVDNGTTMNISLNDGMGNTHDTIISIDELDQGRNIEFAFPEIDYDAIKAEALRVKREEEQRIRDAQIQEMNVVENDVAGLAAVLSQTKNQVAEDTMKIRLGEKDFDEETRSRLAQYVSASKIMQDSLQSYNTKAAIYNYKTQAAEFIKNLSDKPDEKNRKAFENFLSLEKSRTRPLSLNPGVAFKYSRIEDLKFYFTKETINEPIINGKKPLQYAIEMKSNAAVFKYLLANGAEANNFSNRFPDNNEVYATPIAVAMIELGDPEVAKMLLEAGAKFFPPFLTKRQQRMNARYVMEKVKSNTAMMDMLRATNKMPDDGSAAMSVTVAQLDTSIVKLEGSFNIGCISMFAECSSDEKPSAPVSVSSYYISKYEVTQKQWMSVMDYDNPSQGAACEDCPVENVSWEEVKIFIDRLNEYSVPLGKKYRLPTEAEWEFAAKGGGRDSVVTPYSGSTNVNDVAWYKENSAGQVHKVGQKMPNSIGMHDMSGNVAEWCSDWYLENYFASIPNKDPQGPETASKKVIRGGSWGLSAFSSRTTNRDGYDPAFRNGNVGFRLVMEVKQ